MRQAIALALLALVMSACGAPSSPLTAPDVTHSTEARPVGPDMTIAEWNAAGPQLQATYFRGAVSMHITDPARNDTQRRFDDDLALDLRDCVTAQIEQNEPRASDTVRPFITQCLEASGMPPPS